MIFILDIENTFIKMKKFWTYIIHSLKKKKKGTKNRCEDKTIQTPT